MEKQFVVGFHILLTPHFCRESLGPPQSLKSIHLSLSHFTSGQKDKRQSFFVVEQVAIMEKQRVKPAFCKAEGVVWFVMIHTISIILHAGSNLIIVLYRTLSLPRRTESGPSDSPRLKPREILSRAEGLELHNRSYLLKFKRFKINTFKLYRISSNYRIYRAL